MDNSSSVAVTCEGQAELCCCWMMFCCVTTVYSQVVYRRTYASVPWRSNRRLSLGAERARLDSRPAPPLGPQLIMCWSCWAGAGHVYILRVGSLDLSTFYLSSVLQIVCWYLCSCSHASCVFHFIRGKAKRTIGNLVSFHKRHFSSAVICCKSLKTFWISQDDILQGSCQERFWIRWKNEILRDQWQDFYYDRPGRLKTVKDLFFRYAELIFERDRYDSSLLLY